MFRASILLIIGLSLSALVSCMRDVTMDAEERPQVVVACILDDRPEQVLNLSFTKGASLSEAPLLTEAVAILYDGDEKVGEFVRQENGEWTLGHAAVPGHKYRLEVQVPGYDLIHAEQIMPVEYAPVRCFTCTHFERYIEPWSGWEPGGNTVIEPWLPQPDMKWPEDEQYPQYETFYVFFGSSAPVYITAMNYNSETGNHEMAEEICTNAETSFESIPGKSYEPLSIDVPNPYKLKENHSKYKEPFYSAHMMELYPDLTGKPIYQSLVRLPENKPQVFWLSGNFTGEYCYDLSSIWGFADEAETDKGYILCVTPSEDYDKYLQDAYYFMKIQESSDLSTIYLRDNVYTNIVGGLGIFGAQISRKYPWARTYTYVDSGIPRYELKTPEHYSDPREM